MFEDINYIVYWSYVELMNELKNETKNNVDKLFWLKLAGTLMSRKHIIPRAVLFAISWAVKGTGHPEIL